MPLKVSEIESNSGASFKSNSEIPVNSVINGEIGWSVLTNDSNELITSSPLNTITPTSIILSVRGSVPVVSKSITQKISLLIWFKLLLNWTI